MTSSALSRTTLRTALETQRGFLDRDGNKLALQPAFILVPIELEYTAKEILESQILIGTPASNVLAPNANVMQNAIQVVVEPFLTSATTWYLFASPAVAPGLAVGFLNGKDTPDLMLKDPAVRLVLGGNDPYSFEFDEIAYKVRHDWIVKPIEPRGIIKAAA